jgi:hypothetical protein
LDKTKLDAYIIFARVTIVELQFHSTVKPLWVRSHSDKRGPPYRLQEELDIKTDKLAERAQMELPSDLRPRPDALHFPEQQIYVVVAQKKVTSRPHPLNISNMIHGSILRILMMQKEG